MSRCLVVYYSWTGATTKVAKAVAAALSADLEEIKEVKPRRGFLAFFRAGMEATRKMCPDIHPPNRDAASYDVVILGFPVWAHDMASPMRTYLEREKSKLGTIAAFCTLGGAGAGAAIQSVAAICGRTPVAMLSITTGELAAHRWRGKVETFAQDVRRRGAPQGARVG